MCCTTELQSGDDTDPAVTTDDTATLARWKWERSQNGTGWLGRHSRAKYPKLHSPKTGDVGFYLRVTATYSDRDLSTVPAPVDPPVRNNYDNPPVSNAPIRNASKVSEYPVKAANNVNQTPVFPDDEDVTPDIPDVKQQRRAVNENSPKGTVVGPPVSAADAGDVLTYAWTAEGHRRRLRRNPCRYQERIQG